MKVSDILNECLEEKDDFKSLNKVQKLTSKTVIKRAMGRNNADVPDEDVQMVRDTMRNMLATMPLTIEEETPVNTFPDATGGEGVVFSKDVLPNQPSEWELFQKKSLTKAIKVDGPFRVMTTESENEPFYCEDGYLAIDARGYPYAIATEEFELIYEGTGMSSFPQS